LKASDKAHEPSFSVISLSQFKIGGIGRLHPAACVAIRVFCDLYLMKLHGSGVVRKQAIGQQPFFEPEKILNGLRGLNRTHGAGNGAENAGLLAIQNFCGWRRLFEEAAVTSSSAGNHSHGLALPSDDPGM
jgi:hypothetical protein